MREDSIVWLAALLFLGGIAAAVGLTGGIGTAVLTMVLACVVLLILWRVHGDHDRWLPWVGMAAYAAKLAGSATRHWVIFSLYEGVGDAAGYHGRGLEMADFWRAGRLPPPSFGSAGTQFTTDVTGLLYLPHEPTTLGGFYLFATVAFLGQLCFYLAFRRSLPRGRVGLYALAVLFMPSLLFWPSSIGKDALMLGFIGIAALAISHVLSSYRLRWVLVAAIGLGLAAGIRIHVAVLLAGAAAVSALLGRTPPFPGAGMRRVALIAAALLGSFLLLGMVSERLGVELAQDELDPFLADLERRTQQGGSAVEGEAVASLDQIPAATLRVLFRPLPDEAHNLQSLVSAAESVVLLAVIVWRSPRLVAGVRRLREAPYLLFALLATGGFVVIFSAIFNLGILARQRTQILPLLLAVVVGLGWDGRPAEEGVPAELEPVRA